MAENDLRVLRTQRDIQAGFIKVLQTEPFEKVTINDICAAGMVGRSTFYHHYPDKYALLEELVTTQAQHFDHLLDDRMTSVQKDQLLITVYTELTADAELITSLLKIHVVTADLSQRYRDSLKVHLDRLWPELDLNVPREFLLDFYANSALMAITWSLKNGDAEAIATFMNQLVKLLLER